ncbi:NAD dependent epimerase/dehydratase family protein [Lindgomyces ingoldianus]|uniref:NAD dependent epimerase/dehydratase family protein n=1 Tax=Lindgomyces ingoldianus TaxID=673940 RepID=A0ACB6R289_9PLEO|nr:NAD dependent epimerase/dehydratase family protein [Lindgomyces ingoldianus]KAF2472445.1 NAD dependent epimerase/dehydratase family protein [Lindgomyces ingoldianus]
MQSPKILITGATGYIGGTLIHSLSTTTNPTLKTLKISALLRSASQAALFTAYNVSPTILSNPDDLEEVRKIASGFDIILNPAYATLPEHSKALVLGLGDRLASNLEGFVPHMIQVSGTSNLSDRPFTDIEKINPYSSTPEFSDTDSVAVYEMEKKLDALEPYAQRTAELAVIDTGLAVGIKTHNIMSPTIYGPGSGPGNKLSIQIPAVARAAVKNEFAHTVGTGSQEWDHISITDLISLYEILLTRIIEGKPVPSGPSGILFSESGRHTWRQLMQMVADAGVKVGKLQKAEVRSFELQKAADLWGLGAMPAFAELGLASNSKTRAEVARSWGWRPKDRDEEFRKGIEADWRKVVEKDGQ